MEMNFIQEEEKIKMQDKIVNPGKNATPIDVHDYK